MGQPKRPTRADLLAAASNTIPDLLQPHLALLICGINPGLYSAYTGHHFARPGNRFWPTLHQSGFTDRPLRPDQQLALLHYGIGMTCLVHRASATADELTSEELIAGGQQLVQTVHTYQPRVLAVLGITAYRAAFRQPHVQMGQQPDKLGTTEVWILPNPSGLNAHYTLARLVDVFREFRLAIGFEPPQLD